MLSRFLGASLAVVLIATPLPAATHSIDRDTCIEPEMFSVSDTATPANGSSSRRVPLMTAVNTDDQYAPGDDYCLSSGGSMVCMTEEVYVETFSGGILYGHFETIHACRCL